MDPFCTSAYIGLAVLNLNTGTKQVSCPSLYASAMSELELLRLNLHCFSSGGPHGYSQTRFFSRFSFPESEGCFVCALLKRDTVL